MNYVVITHTDPTGRVETRLKIVLDKKLRLEVVMVDDARPSDETILKYLHIARRMLEQ